MFFDFLRLRWKVCTLLRLHLSYAPSIIYQREEYEEEAKLHRRWLANCEKASGKLIISRVMESKAFIFLFESSNGSFSSQLHKSVRSQTRTDSFFIVYGFPSPFFSEFHFIEFTRKTFSAANSAFPSWLHSPGSTSYTRLLRETPINLFILFS